MKTKIEIKSIWGEVLFSFEKENNTIKDTVEEAVMQGANLDGANLYGANLYGANLYGANLYGANLYGANLNRANLDRANLNRANLDRASLDGATLYGANLYGATLNRANLDRASLDGATLYGANLYGASLDGATNIPYISLNCPSDGAFIGWKKVAGLLVQLEIPADAKRSSATSMKCRCDKAKVVSITSLDGKKEHSSVENKEYNPHITYKVGEMVYPDSFDDNRWDECSHGIHFFINKQDAINY